MHLQAAALVTNPLLCLFMRTQGSAELDQTLSQAHAISWTADRPRQAKRPHLNSAKNRGLPESFPAGREHLIVETQRSERQLLGYKPPKCACTAASRCQTWSRYGSSGQEAANSLELGTASRRIANAPAHMCVGHHLKQP